MQQQDVRADKFIYICIIRVCNAEGALLQGQLVHTLLIEGNLRLDKDVLKVLIDMYAMCGCISDACRVFESSSYQDALSWGVLISACVEGGHSQLAFRSFTKMQELGLTPDGATIACILKACGCNDDILQSKLIHHHLISEDDYLDSKIGNILISTYFKCGLLREAAYVFEQVPNLTVTSWDSIISGYSRNGYGFQALEYFQKMQAQGTAPGPSTFACALKSCGIEQLSCQGRLLHDQIVRNGIEKNLVVGNSLVDMYANCGGFSDAQNVFMNMTLKDKISWGAILSCNSICGNLSNVLELYSEMRTDGIQLDNVTASYVIKTCSITGLTKLGRLIHDQVIRYGIETDVVVGTALVDMYAKFSSPKEAQQTCGKIQDVNEIACTALLSAFAQDNQIHLIKGLINDLETEGFVPDTHTHRSIATTLTHSGRSNETNQYIEDIIEGSVIKPATNHFNYVVDSLSRIGQLQKAAELLLTMPLPPDVTGWVSLLTACQMFGNTDVGLECLDNVAKLNCSGTGSFVMIAQMYADAQKWTKVSNILDIRKNVGAWKIPGQAWLEVIDGIHRFSTGDSLSPQTEVLSYKVVRRKMREQGFIPQLNLVMEFTAKYDANEAVFSDSRFTQDEVS
ncbi:hypothetical protein KP509_39G028600 [Ceratopteris richardii]|nr:hypothetical protein KP509_39G028600 [Ceratopteris richardii]